MKEELSYQESKVQQYKKEVEKLRSQQSQRGKVGPSYVFNKQDILLLLRDQILGVSPLLLLCSRNSDSSFLALFLLCSFFVCLHLVHLCGTPCLVHVSLHPTI